jgi:hypothetical protein
MRASSLTALLVVLPFVTGCPLDKKEDPPYQIPDADLFGGQDARGWPDMGGPSGGGGSAPAGTGGVSGTGGSSGAGGSPAAGGACRVKCLEDLVGKCTLAAGSCVGEANLDTGTSNVCYSNGVKYLTSIQGTTTIGRYLNPDGSTCYIMESVPGADFTKVTAYWKDGSGQLVATQMTDIEKKTSSYVCAAGGSYQLGAECWGQAAGGGNSTSGGCGMGSCR